MSGQRPSLVTVRANWPKTTAWLVLPAVALAVVIDVLRMMVLHQQGIASTEVILGAGVLAVLIFELGFFFVSAREVRLSYQHAEFVIGMRRVTVPWADLVPPSGPLRLSINFFYRRDGEIQDDGLQVTRAQAVAILSYPTAPRFELSGDILRSLRLAANPGHSGSVKR
jgi:hypothetical protein